MENQGVLKATFYNVFKSFNLIDSAIDPLWSQVVKQYSSSSRYYHNLDHLAALHAQFETYRDVIKEPTSFLLCMFYHDIIYKAIRKDNEQASADLMEQIALARGVPSSLVVNAKRQIICTAKHELSTSSRPDDAFFLDFDLGILGTSWDEYLVYTEQIRKEYWMFPSILYKKGRQKVLAHFLERPNLYFTEVYQDLKEAKARANIEKELLFLNK